MFRKDLVAALVGLLCVVQIKGDCLLEEFENVQLNDKIICTDSVFNILLLKQYLRPTSDIIATKISDLTEDINTMKMNTDGLVDSIKISDSNITSLPSDLLTIEKLKHLSLPNNKIKSINLSILPSAEYLVSLNLSYNIIEEFETESTTYKSTKALSDIDLSHNKLERVPINCFYSVRDSLEILNLSYNQISTIDLYAFSNLLLLKTLRLSHNNIARFGFFLYPLKNLRNLDIDHNLIKEISATNFNKSTFLAKLDVSYNNIDLIDDHSFGALTALTELNLSNNYLTSIKEIMLRNNNQLSSFDFSYNNISYIEPGTFTSMGNLNHIGLEHAFAMPIQVQVFAGAKVTELNFAGSTISKIEDQPFISIRNTLLNLNLSSCEIYEISETAFDALTELVVIDISNNKLTEIAFQTTDLENLSKLNLRNNLIREIKPQAFEHLLSLKVLDLSNNAIQTLPAMMFKNMKNLEVFKITNNNLDSTLCSNTFYGLEKVEHLELINTKVQKWDIYAFSGLKSLKSLNASYGQLGYIDQYAFTETGNIEILDLSHNRLQNFNVKLLPNNKLKELYLNNNQIGSFSKKLFEELVVLKKINLSYNNLYTLESLAFTLLKSLSYLDLSHNPDLKLSGNIFDSNNELDTVLMRNVSNQITFESSNVSIRYLDISSNKISNVSLLRLKHIKQLVKLDLARNNINVLDKFSFGDITHLSSFTFLNLSDNKISVIKAGTFLKANSIMYLDLSNNKLDKIKFGTFSGLDRLHTLDLSNNALSSFKMKLLYNIPSVSTIYLDNNIINSLALTANTYNLQKLSVGGNYLTCENLLDLTINKNFSTLTARDLDYYTENVDGIACVAYEMIM